MHELQTNDVFRSVIYSCCHNDRRERLDVGV